MMKNLDVATVLTLRDQVAYQPGQVVSKTLAQNDAVSVTLFAFDKDEEISTHESGGDALVTCLDGVGRVTVDGVPHVLHTGESILMPARHPHAVYGQEQFKMLLVVVFRERQTCVDLLWLAVEIVCCNFHRVVVSCEKISQQEGCICT